MKKTVLLPVLAIVLAAAVLLGLSFGLRNVAAQKAQAEHLRLMQTILPGSTEFTLEPYTGDDANIVSVHKGETGFVVETSVYGYAGDISMLVAVTKEGKVTGLVVLDLSETPGLGANALVDHEFLAQFLNTEGGVAIGAGEDAVSSATSADAQETEVYVDGISGATVSSKAIARSINSAAAYVTGADIESSATP